MPSDSNLDKIPPSPIDDDDLWLINREDKSYKVTSKMLGGYLITSPVPEICEDTSDCPPDRECVDGYCERIPCDSEQPPGQEGCPPDFVCIGDYCYPKCDIGGVPCGEGYVCVDPGITGGDAVCLPYPFPCRPDLLPGDGCPPGYVCWGGNCYQTCLNSGGPPGVGQGSQCPPGMECVEFSDPDFGVGYICVPSAGGFPCVDGQCPAGYDCFFGMCFAKCGDPSYPNNGVCDEGFQCVNIDGTDYCVPYPFPCDLYGPGCPDGMTCYNGECYQNCDPSGAPCEDGFVCTDIGGGDFICYPETPTEGFVNDGPLVIRTEPVNFPDTPATESIVFTANQFGRSVLTFQGFDQNPGGPGGGICSGDGDCPPGYSCVGGVCVYIPCSDDTDCDHPDWTMVCENGFCFPSCSNVEGSCPSGYECVDGICLPGGVHPIGECGPNGECPSGYQCVDGYCVPKPCSSTCGPDEYCFNGYCYPKCNNITGCGPNHICVEVVPPTLPDGSDGISICMPIGGGPDGGGSGGDININIDPDWWNPENGLSPINDGPLNLEGKKKDDVSTDTSQLVFTSNQKSTSKISYEWPLFLTPGADLEASVGISTGYWFPKGTRMLFQGAPPAGWTRQTGYQNIGLRVISDSNPGVATGGSLTYTNVHKLHDVPLKSHNHNNSLSGGITKAGGHFHEFTITRSNLNRTSSPNNFTYEPDELIDELLQVVKYLNDEHQIITDDQLNILETCTVYLGFRCRIFNVFLEAYEEFRTEVITLQEFRDEMTDEIAEHLQEYPTETSYPFSHFSRCEGVECPLGSVCLHGICVADTGYTYDDTTDSFVLRLTDVVDTGPDEDCDYCPVNSKCDNGICECESGFVRYEGKCVDPSTIIPVSYVQLPQVGPVTVCKVVFEGKRQARNNNTATFTCQSGNCTPGHSFVVSNQGIPNAAGWIEVPQNIETGSTYKYVLNSVCIGGECGCIGVDHKITNGGSQLEMEDNMNCSGNIDYTDLMIRTNIGTMTKSNATTGTYTVSAVEPCDPCSGVSCPGGQTCVNGKCECPTGQELVNGNCVLKVYKSSSSGEHTHPHTFSVSNNSAGGTAQLDLRVTYVDVIVAEKD